MDILLLVIAAFSAGVSLGVVIGYKAGKRHARLVYRAAIQMNGSELAKAFERGKGR